VALVGVRECFTLYDWLRITWVAAAHSALMPANSADEVP